MSKPSLSDPTAYANPSAECDVVMKGGISSGIVYPRAACQLATSYRFRRLGGASAGAIAAAAVAAAEYGRDRGGFVKLNNLPDQLGTKLASLFQPTPKSRAAFDVLSVWLEPGWGRFRKGRSTAKKLIAGAPLLFGVVVVLLLLPEAIFLAATLDQPHGWAYWVAVVVATLIWVPIAFGMGLIAAAARRAWTTYSVLPEQGFGLCNGHAADPAVKDPPLTDWLCSTIDDIAGLPPGAGPLTIGHLWGEEAVELHEKLKSDASLEDRTRAQTARLIDIEVMTTSLTLSRPYRFPFDERIFYFCEQRFRDYFPDSVVDHLVNTSTEAKDRTDKADGKETTIAMRCPCHDKPVRSMPRATDIPVVLAARLSLSFPVLLSAVPFFCVDYARAPGKRGLIEVWFSDGGISSNFPMHFFDSLLPSRPTFGINLSPAHRDYPDLVWKPKEQGGSGLLPLPQEIASLTSFLRSILTTMQNWVDATQITMPGFRDRVAVIRQRPGEGGMNLKMSGPVIDDLADRGANAAALFDDFDFDLHRWIRYRVAMPATDDMLTEMSIRYDEAFRDFIKDYSPTTRHFSLGSGVRSDGDRDATTRLMELATELANTDHPHGQGSIPKPKPDLRIIPRQ